MTSTKIDDTINQLRQLTQLDLQENWRYSLGDLSTDVPRQQVEYWNQQSPARLTPKKTISWSAGRQVLWLGLYLVIPDHFQGYPLPGLVVRLSLTWWAEFAQIYVNGRLVQEGDLFESSTRVTLSQNATVGESFLIALRLVSPGHDEGALVRSQLICESPNRIDPGFVADELAILKIYLETNYPEKICLLEQGIDRLDFSAVSDRDQFDESLDELRRELGRVLPAPNLEIALLGHAHLDLAWLWTTAETWDVAQRTFSSVLQLQKDCPELIFSHTTAVLYNWIEEHRPDLFSAIQKQVEIGRWEVLAGLWVEPDLNLINGESIVRQILYGQRYHQDKFGFLCQIAWLPDSFGFCWQLPQLLKQGGFDYFTTQKLTWNDTTEFPYSVFWWEAPDGTQILSLMSAPIGEKIDPVKMAAYAVEFREKTGLRKAMWLPGVGDRGGGPTRDMLEVARRWQTSPFFPKMEFTTAQTYLQEIAESEMGNFPVWQDELYLEFHRGCYTSRADRKRGNRRCEQLLYRAELFAAIASITAEYNYPKIELENAWKTVLFNQFHDILPGSAIASVYEDADRDGKTVESVGEKIWQESIKAIASQITRPQPPELNARPLLIINPLTWKRTEVVTIRLPNDLAWEIIDLEGKIQPSQQEKQTLYFLASNIPPTGYRLFWLVPEKGNSKNKRIFSAPSSFILENAALQVEIDPETGDLTSVFDKHQQREILTSAGNQLQAFQDSGQYWDAWNIDPNYAKHPLPPSQLKSMAWQEVGNIRQRLRVVRQLGNSEFTQDYILERESPILKIATKVNWNSPHVLVKAAFPVNIEVDWATYEIPSGAIRRPTRPQTAQQKAKWEVPALNWGDLSNETWGVSLLNDCKYGYDARANQLRLTLMRGATWPDKTGDRGYHEFTYALYPHSGSWESAGTLQRGCELNQPLQGVLLCARDFSISGKLAPVGQFLDLQAENLILMALKQSEDNPQQWVIRCYECCGQEALLEMASDLKLEIISRVDLLERPRSKLENSLQINPWQIASFVATAEKLNG